ncbi:hypothetical protein CARUB_v10007002mg, partial [Capsella rubella]
GEDDIVELLWKSGQVVPSSQIQRSSSHPLPILRGSGSGSGEGNDPLPHPTPSLQHHDQQSLFIQEDEMASWLPHPNRQDYFYSSVSSTPATLPQILASLAPPPPSIQDIMTPERPTGQIFSGRRAENFMNFSRLRGNICTGGRVEAGPSMQVESSATPSSFATESCVIPATEGTKSRVLRTFSVPSLGRDEKMASENAGTKPIQTQPASEISEDRKRKEREETNAEIQGTEEARDSSVTRKKSRAAEMHNLSERRRREKINEKMKTLQELIPGCSKKDKASTLEFVIEYVKSLQMQVQMMSMGQGTMPPMMNAGNVQPLMPNMAMRMMDMNRPPFIPFPGTPFPRPPHMEGIGPSRPALAPPYPYDPSRVHLRTPQPNLVSTQPQFPAYMNPYSQFVGLHRMQQPPTPLHSQTTSPVSFSDGSNSKEHDDQDNQSTG